MFSLLICSINFCLLSSTELCNWLMLGVTECVFSLDIVVQIGVLEGLDKRKSFICNSSILLVNQVTDQNYEIFEKFIFQQESVGILPDNLAILVSGKN